MFFSYIIFTTSPHSSFPLSTFKLISCLSLVTFQDSCSILFWLTHWTSFVQTFPSVVSCRLQHRQSDLDYIFNCSSVFFYAFPFSSLCHLSFSVVQHFVLSAISSTIFYLWYHFLLHLLFIILIFFLLVTLPFSIPKVSCNWCTFL